VHIKKCKKNEKNLLSQNKRYQLLKPKREREGSNQVQEEIWSKEGKSEKFTPTRMFCSFIETLTRGGNHSWSLLLHIEETFTPYQVSF
jgi:hypothetical protein